MKIKEIISTDFPTVRKDDKGETILRIMDDMKVSHIPMISADNELISLVSEKDIYNSVSLNKAIKLDKNEKSPFVKNNEQPTIVANTFATYGCTVLPAIDSESKLYCGAITLKDFALAFFNNLNHSNIDAIITIKINIGDYILSQLSHIVEQNNGRIITLFLHSSKQSDKRSELVLYISTSELQAVIESLERFGYNITNIIDKNTNEDAVTNDHYCNLINYLSV